jgi:pilus assembly protein TadC
MDEAQDEKYEELLGKGSYWWIRQFVLIVIAGFYLIFGIQLLVSAYRLNEPTSFIYTFYASNFIILFSGALLVGFVYRLVAIYRRRRNRHTQSLP